MQTQTSTEEKQNLQKIQQYEKFYWEKVKKQYRSGIVRVESEDFTYFITYCKVIKKMNNFFSKQSERMCQFILRHNKQNIKQFIVGYALKTSGFPYIIGNKPEFDIQIWLNYQIKTFSENSMLYFSQDIASAQWWLKFQSEQLTNIWVDLINSCKKYQDPKQVSNFENLINAMKTPNTYNQDKISGPILIDRRLPIETTQKFQLKKIVHEKKIKKHDQKGKKYYQKLKLQEQRLKEQNISLKELIVSMQKDIDSFKQNQKKNNEDKKIAEKLLQDQIEEVNDIKILLKCKNDQIEKRGEQIEKLKEKINCIQKQLNQQKNQAQEEKDAQKINFQEEIKQKQAQIEKYQQRSLQQIEFQRKKTIQEETIAKLQKKIEEKLSELFFHGQLLASYPEHKLFIKNQVEKVKRNKIYRTSLIYKSDPLNTTTFHKYVDEVPNIVLIVKTETGLFFGAFSEGAIDSNHIANRQGIIMSMTHEKVFPVLQGKRSVTYDSFYLIIGNSEIRLKHGEQKVFCNFGINNGYYSSKGGCVDDLIGEGKEREAKIQGFEVHRVIFQ